jgi:ribA/ribD-fused uncharacterized protein
MNSYYKHEVVSFLKTNEAFGGLSNMAGGYLITLYGVRFRTSEHLYQALKFPDHPEIQLEIAETPSPIAAKMVARKRDYQPLIRPDWEEIKLPVMAYCLRAKLRCNFQEFGDLLRSTGSADIVEVSSKKDTFWGCVPDGDLLVGHNHLGVLLTDLRDELVLEGEGAGRRMELPPPAGVALRINGRPVGTLQFGFCDDKAIDEFIEAIRIKHSTKLNQLNSTNGGI